MLGKAAFIIWLMLRFECAAVRACEPFAWVVCCLYINVGGIQIQKQVSKQAKTNMQK